MRYSYLISLSFLGGVLNLKVLKFLGFCLSVFLVTFICFYFVYTFVMFPPNSVLDYGLGTLEVGQEKMEVIQNSLKEAVLNYNFNIKTVNNKVYIVPLSDFLVDSDLDFSDKLNEIEKNLFNTEYTMTVTDILQIDKDKVYSYLNYLEEDKGESVESQNAYIVFDTNSNSFIIQKEEWGNILIDEASELLLNAIFEYQQNISLQELGCYEPPLIYSNNEVLKSELDIYKEYQQTIIEYTFGENRDIVDVSVYNSWLIPNRDEQGILDKEEPFSLDSEAIKEYVTGLNEKYSTVKKQREFITTLGTKVNLIPGNYGWSINISKMVDDISQHILNKESETKELVFSTKADILGDNDIGNSYIEISIENQKLWMYVKGELLVETSVVTGSVKDGHSTPKGIFVLSYKTRNATLRGPGYASFVNYWMPFNGGVGLHDATWRSSFGGTIYKNNGSHGCINMPLQYAKIVYNNITPTMPIIVW